VDKIAKKEQSEGVRFLLIRYSNTVPCCQKYNFFGYFVHWVEIAFLINKKICALFFLSDFSIYLLPHGVMYYVLQGRWVGLLGPTVT